MSVDRMDVYSALVEVSEFLDNYVDVLDGDYGEPRPNRAMSLKTEVDKLIERLAVEPTPGPSWVRSLQSGGYL